MDGRQTLSAAETLTAAVDALLATEPAGLSPLEVTGLLELIETQRRRLEAVDQRLLAAVVEQHIAGEFGRTSPTDLLVSLLRVTPREATARVDRARDLGPRRALTGEPLEPIFPEVADTAAAGEISAGHVDVITSCLDRVSCGAKPEMLPVAEQFLLEAARHEHPRALAKTAQLLLARLDPDGQEPKDDEVERKRGFSLAKHSDGSSTPRGHWSPELTALWEPILDALAAPLPGDEPDGRTASQRRHDAMAEAAGRLLRSNTLPHAGGAPVTVLARTTMTELKERTGVAVTGHGEQLSIGRLLQMAADAHVIPVICTDTGGVLAYGRARRLAAVGQRHALAARDGGCSFPGCNRPAAWTEVHHVREWIDGGETNIDEMCLLCRFHHRMFAKLGWEVVMLDGVPHWIPPAWLDPHRRPRRNTAHHLPDFDRFDRRRVNLGAAEILGIDVESRLAHSTH
jgi:Domain of unknown function (DUF222)